MDTETYKAKLIAKRDELLLELQSLGRPDPLVKSDWTASLGDKTTAEADSDLVADRTEEWEAENSTIDVLETDYRNVLRALNKIKSGDFGSCEVCQQVIEEERLTVNPAARTCLKHLEEEGNLKL